VRPQIEVYIAMSLDGYIAQPDGGIGWLEEAAAPGEDYGFEAFLAGVDAVAMGRGTYDVIADVADLPYGTRPVYVFTHRRPGARAGFTFWARTPDEAVADWAVSGHTSVYLDGGALVSQFLAAGLVDALTVTVVPVLLGGGLALFHPGPRSTALRLVGVDSWPSGMAQLRYACR
jgi:dihydrofolate reductase